MQIQNKIILSSFGVALMMTSAASAQRRATPARPGEVGVAITLQVAGQPYHFQGNAACRHEPVASIYNVVAGLWSVQQSDGKRSLTLTLWRPRSKSGDMFSLSVTNGAKSYVINTVRGGGNSAVQGSGQVTVTPSGAGGTFRINGTAENGATITGTIQCSAFGEVMAVGG